MTWTPPTVHILVYTGLLFLLSQAAGRLANAFGLPRLIGYLAIGVLGGPSVLVLFPDDVVHGQLHLLIDIALAIIAYSIGGSLELGKIRRLRATILGTTLLQAIAAAMIVGAAVYLLLPVFADTASDIPRAAWFSVAVLVGALSAATAPAAVLSLVHEYKARGPLTTVLLGVVALDDGVTLVLYAFASVVAASILGGGAFSWQTALVSPLAAIGGSLLVGVLVAAGVRAIIRYFAPEDVMLGLIVGAILLTTGLAWTFDWSPLLAPMALGFVIRNYVEHARAIEAFTVVERIEEPIFGIFFALAGAHIDVDVLAQAGGLALVLVITRFAGKLAGTRLGAELTQAPRAVKKYLGLALLPAAGVTIGLALELQRTFSPMIPSVTQLVVSAIVANTLINELLTPFLVRYALFAAKEARGQHDIWPHIARRARRRTSPPSARG